MAAETVTVLFTDLVGSTDLASRLGPTAADELRRSHFGLLRGAVADSGGTEVKNLGDGLMVVFTSPSQALACAVAMQQAIDRHNRKAVEPLAIRIGVSAGEAMAEDDDYFGEPVVEAARLCAMAGGGQIVLSDVLRVMTRGRGHEMTSMGQMELKGLAEPVAVCRLEWAPDESEGDATLIPLPVRVVEPTVIGFVGRSEERELLQSARKAAFDGNTQRVVLVSGEGGMGKTSLAFEIARAAHADGAIVLYGRCDEDLGIPYQPFVEALHHYAVHAPDEWLKNHDPQSLAELTRLVPAFSKRQHDLPKPTASESDAEPSVLFAAISSVLSELTSEASVLLILDDVHWADRPTLQLLRVLAGASIPRLLIIGTFRDSGLSAHHPLTEALAALRREPVVERITLSGLSDVEILAYMEAAAGHQMDESGLHLRAELLRETDGNPFFVREVLLHLVETGALAQEGDRWVATSLLQHAGLPESVREVVGARVGRLGADVSTVLAAAAVIGQEFDLDLLCAITERDEDTVLEALDAAGRGGLTIESPTAPGKFRFAHALVQHTIYQDLGPTRQARLHGRAAVELEALSADTVNERIGELARHFLAATRPAEVGKASAYARQAGDRAMAASAPDEAVRWYTQALEALGPAADRVDRIRCLINLGHAKRLASAPDFRDVLYEATDLATQLGDRALIVEAALMNNRSLMSRVGIVDSKLVGVLQAALAVVGPEDSIERARLLSSLASELSFDPDIEYRQSVAAEAVAVARRTGDAATLYDALVRPFMAVCVPDLVDLRLEMMREAMTLSDRVEDPDPAFAAYAHFWYAVTLVEMGQLQGVDAGIEALSEACVKAPSSRNLWGLNNLKGWRAQLAGDLATAEVCATAALEAGTESGQPEAFSMYAGQIFVIRYYQGRMGEMVPMARQAAEDQGVPALVSALALAEALEGDRAAAASLLREQTARGFDHPYDPNWLTAIGTWAEVAAEMESEEAASVLFDMLKPFPHLTQVGTIVALPGVAYHLGRLATVLRRPAEADRYFAQALEIHERLEAPFHIATTKVYWAAALTERDPARARALATDALDVARRHGFGHVERTALEVLG